ncbi:hypothetical protein [Thalassoroseus pseudoceratinae]|uniref:hypothetical protein n=1 Tax=Thalassoroseus pseudoceratinae TaxID=2713176 RepID=UPI00141FB590|nr:hypothetical protein [Thalassoroseus pseudoceratinae]
MTDAPRPKRQWTWLVLCVVLSGIAAFITARLPVTMQKPGITSLWLAGIIGALVAWLARENSVDSQRVIIGLAATLGILPALGLTGQRYWLYRQSKIEEYLGDLNGSSAIPPDAVQLYTENATPPANLREQFRADREAALQQILPFDTYLTTRLAAFGIGTDGRSRTIALVSWTFEILLSGVAASVVARLTHRALTSTESPV